MLLLCVSYRVGLLTVMTQQTKYDVLLSTNKNSGAGG